jgi:hypothetical protein
MSARPPHIDERYARNSSTYANHGCRCDDCTTDASRVSMKNTRRRRRESPEARRRMNRNKDRRFNRDNAEAAAAADRHHKPWTSRDVAIARDRTLSVRQAAKILGRSFNSVKHMRRQGNRYAEAAIEVRLS